MPTGCLAAKARELNQSSSFMLGRSCPRFSSIGKVGTEDVLRWSPVVWLLGVCVAGTLMNLVFYCQKKYRERKRRRRDQQHDLLYSLAIPRSYPCLAPPPHLGCCRSTQVSVSNRGLPSYEDVVTQKLEDNSLPPNYVDAVTMMNSSTPVSVQTQTTQTIQSLNSNA
ncbi:hypothetical protein KIN20_004702 [Parelaphostrongylus tenuis]|uniref:Uncharacterized protein n=1 Tax=Parelaphostrongylus tenuis TaxID=148309 RepID=A0AAD5MRS1_PARTN|nr:hypothetical protein KIN20_004702 [Parelaphostrongylus tenuis]